MAAQGRKADGIARGHDRAADRRAVVDAVGPAFGGALDVLVNNAGGNIRKKALDYTPEEVERLLARNFTSAFELSRWRIRCSSAPPRKAGRRQRGREHRQRGGADGDPHRRAVRREQGGDVAR